MSARGTMLGVLAAIGILAVGWQAGASGVTQKSTGVATGSGSTSSGTGTGTGSGAGAAASSSSDGEWTGQSVSTRYGHVQVAVTIAGGTVTDVTAVHLTDADRRSVSISNRAAPVLRSEVLSAQSAHVSTVGGATYTSEGYLTSLQSALDQAGF